MAQIHISKDPSRLTAVTFGYGPLLATKAKTVFKFNLLLFTNILQIISVMRKG
jgi:hypothetical protein